jgi:hypothetical protein
LQRDAGFAQWSGTPFLVSVFSLDLASLKRGSAIGHTAVTSHPEVGDGAEVAGPVV